MKVLYKPVVVEGVDYNPGFSGFCLIDFSHISIHTFLKTGEICVDIFSCKPYNPERVKNYLLKVFAPKRKDIVCFEVAYPK